MADPILTYPIIAFDEHIAPIFKRYREPMLNIGIATPDGVFSLDLGDYESVKLLNERITIAIHGYEPGRESSHPMPPKRNGVANPLPAEQLKAWDDWVAGGMIKSLTFDEHIAPIFKKYREPMLKIGIAKEDGVFSLDLGDYDSVKMLNERITIAIHGYEPGRESSHPMPPERPDGTPNPLPAGQIKTWDDWVAAGMKKS